MLRKFITGFLIVQMVLWNVVPVSAQEVSSEPTPTPEVSIQTQSTTTESPTPSSEPSATPPTEEISSSPSSQEAPSTQSSEPPATQQAPIDPRTDRDAYIAEQESLAIQAWENANPQLAALAHQSGQLGDTAVVTGDANNSASVVSTGNANLAASPLGGDSGGASVVTNDNGAFSSNSGSASIVNNSDTNQNNNATVVSGLDGNSVTGSNNGSFAVGNSDLTTGDANTTGTVITAANTNVSGVMVSEFNIVDDHVGDIILDFGAASNAVGGGSSATSNVANNGNGASSDNNVNANVADNNNTFQNNDGTVGNNLVLSADSGNNNASYNTGGDSSITTGDANVAANVLSFLNNNIAGGVVFSVINIFGNLIGDIIFPESQLNCCGPSTSSGLNLNNTGNGANSTNNANASLTNNNATNQTNDATITNNLVFDAQTGDNSASFNTGGDSTISTGQANVDANVLNIANTNISGGNMWLVLINHAGNWFGKLIGAPEGQSFMGSEGLEFSLGSNGEINVSNNGNGADSTNTAGVATTTNNTATQSNTGNIQNTLHLSANTGGNDANFNTGGNSTIQTGNANIIANLVNFINNNISGGGKLFVTIVNVFGSWTGDFVGPGQTKEAKNTEQKTENNNAVINGSHSSNLSNPSNQNSSKSSNSSSSTQQAGALSVSTATNGNSYSPRTSITPNALEVGTGTGLLASAEKVAGMSTNAKATEQKGITINLAWLLVILPMVLLVIVIRRLVMRRIV